jgi:hypothetical protein
MEENSLLKEISIILLASAILGISYSYPNQIKYIPLYISFFLVIIAVNVLAKKYAAYYFEAEANTKFWSIYQYYFKRSAHFKTPIYMLWFPLFLSIFSKGYLFWMPILEFEIKPKIERVARRHEGLFRFTEMTEWHIALIIMWGIIANIALSIVTYFLGGYIPQGELLSKLSIFYVLWSLLPISSLDGTKLFAGSRPLWFSILVIVAVFLFFGAML